MSKKVNFFKKGTTPLTNVSSRYWKKRKTEDSYDPDEEGSYHSENDTCHLDVETDFTQITEPNSDASFRFLSQGAYGGDENNLYVLIAKRGDNFVGLMDRKIGGAMMGHFNGPTVFEHMQNVSSLEFSVDLEGGPESFKDWTNPDGTWSEDTQERKNFLNSLPELLRTFLEQYPMETFYSRWLFGYGW